MAHGNIQAGQWELQESFGDLQGWWGNTFVGDAIGFVFPVQDGCTTQITLSFSKLEVGILDSSGTKALEGMDVNALCVSKDVAGKFAPDTRCPG